jgi:hypothetical protein
MAPRRPKRCTRALHLGPGSCWWWWESCPAGVADCWQRAVRTALPVMNARWPDHCQAMACVVAEALAAA